MEHINNFDSLFDGLVISSIAVLLMSKLVLQLFA